jgi:hypothetical protein
MVFFKEILSPSTLSTVESSTSRTSGVSSRDSSAIHTSLKKRPPLPSDEGENATKIVPRRRYFVNSKRKDAFPLLISERLIRGVSFPLPSLTLDHGSNPTLSPVSGMHLAHKTRNEKRSSTMTVFQIAQLLSAMAAGLFLIGLVTFATGVAVLVSRSIGQDTRTISKQVSLLAKKGIAEDISGLVGNASSLLSATSDLIRTTKGIGVFLIISGSLSMLLGIGLTLYLGLS